MTDPNLTLIAVVLDRSGSMGACLAATIDGFNKLLAEQKAQPGRAVMTLVAFNHLFQTLADFTELEKVPALSLQNYVPDGNTALYDAQGMTIDIIGKRLSGLPEAMRPGKVVFVTITDGQENASHEYNAKMVRERIEHQRERYGWQFLYLGANQDAVLEAGKLGIGLSNTANYNATGVGTQVAYRMVGSKLSSVRSANSAGEIAVAASFSDAEKAELEEQK